MSSVHSKKKKKKSNWPYCSNTLEVDRVSRSDHRPCLLLIHSTILHINTQRHQAPYYHTSDTVHNRHQKLVEGQLGYCQYQVFPSPQNFDTAIKLNIQKLLIPSTTSQCGYKSCEQLYNRYTTKYGHTFTNRLHSVQVVVEFSTDVCVLHEHTATNSILSGKYEGWRFCNNKKQINQLYCLTPAALHSSCLQLIGELLCFAPSPSSCVSFSASPCLQNTLENARKKIKGKHFL